MVTALSPHDTTIVAESLSEARRVTAAKITVIARPTSATYDGTIIVGGLLLGTALSFAAWSFEVVLSVPWLFCLQLGTTALLDVIHHRTAFLIRLVPRRLRDRHAQHEAFRAYHALLAHRSSPEPFVLLFVSLAERYVHVMPNPVVHHVLPDDWHHVTEAFGRDIRDSGLGLSCQKAIAHIAVRLAPFFPPLPPSPSEDTPHAS